MRCPCSVVDGSVTAHADPAQSALRPPDHVLESVGDQGDLREVYDTERHLLYVACTRARDDLLVASAEYPSELLDDLEA